MPPRGTDALCRHAEEIGLEALRNGAGLGSRCPSRHPRCPYARESDTRLVGIGLSQRVYPCSCAFDVALDSGSAGGSEDSNRELRSIATSYVDGPGGCSTERCEG